MHDHNLRKIMFDDYTFHAGCIVLVYINFKRKRKTEVVDSRVPGLAQDGARLRRDYHRTRVERGIVAPSPRMIHNMMVIERVFLRLANDSIFKFWAFVTLTPTF